MSWDFDLCDPVTKEVLSTKEKHMIQGGTCCVGGTTAMTLNVTYNYSDIINKKFKELEIDNKNSFLYNFIYFKSSKYIIGKSSFQLLICSKHKNMPNL